MKATEKEDLRRFERFHSNEIPGCSKREALEIWDKWARDGIWTVGELINALSKLDKDKMVRITDRYDSRWPSISKIVDGDKVRLMFEFGLALEQDI